MKLLLLLLVPVALATDPDNHIINGANADIANMKYQGSLQPSQGSHYCGCSLVSWYYAISAAHCGGTSGWVTQWGSATLGYGTFVGVSSVTLHPYYLQGSGFWSNDISIVYLPGGVVGDNIGLIPITAYRVTSGTATISGWGALSGDGPSPQNLQYRNMPVISDAQATGYWGSGYVSDYHICVFDGQGGACFGDSGGPLAVSGYLHGVASFVGGNCDYWAYPSTYVRVSHFVSWICGSTGNAAYGC